LCELLRVLSAGREAVMQMAAGDDSDHHLLSLTG